MTHQLKNFDEHAGRPRAFMRFLRKTGMCDPVYQAYSAGEALAYYGPRNMPPRLRQNPYPPGRRHDEFERGYRTADPLGDWHGRNY